MPLHEDDVRRIASLAQIEMDDAQVRHLAPQIATILDHVAAVAGLDVASVPPMAHPGSSAPPREDEIAPSLGAERAVAAAAESQAGHFVVPRVLSR